MEVADQGRTEILLDDDQTQPVESTMRTIRDYMEALTDADKRLSLYEKCKFISTNARFLSMSDRKAVGNLFIEHGKKACIKEASDGCRIALDNIADEPFINRVMAYIKNSTVGSTAPPKPPQ